MPRLSARSRNDGRSWPVPPVAVVVLLTGFVITAALAWSAFAANDRASKALLEVQTRQTASALSASLPAIQSELTDALSVATATKSPRTFMRFATSNAGRSNLVSESLWERTDAGTTLLADSGSPPQLIRDGHAAAFFAKVQPSSGLQVTDILPGSPPRLGYAEFPSRSSHYIVYGESALPANKHLDIPNSSPFSQLNVALYLGRSPSNGELIASSVAAPITGTHATVTVPFGDSALTLVASARSSLTPGASQALPWIALGAGTALSLATAGTADYLARRRGLADQLNTRLSKLYREQRGIAETLQEALLPASLPAVPGTETACRYVPGTRGMEIGGDWYDVVALDSHRLFFVIGDVSGRGVQAAAVMARLRYATLAYVYQLDAPEVILGKLCRMIDFTEAHHFATVACGVIDVAARQLTLANAGHLPVLLVGELGQGSGGYRLLSAEVGPPIGVAAGHHFSPVTVEVPSTATLLAVTDGLIERRNELIDLSLKRLADAAMAHNAQPLEELVTTLVEEFTRDGTDDDAAILGVRWHN